jgi:hypothetical protein
MASNPGSTFDLFVLKVPVEAYVGIGHSIVRQRKSLKHYHKINREF